MSARGGAVRRGVARSAGSARWTGPARRAGECCPQKGRTKKQKQKNGDQINEQSPGDGFWDDENAQCKD
jgi:hypothetical protein